MHTKLILRWRHGVIFFNISYLIISQCQIIALSIYFHLRVFKARILKGKRWKTKRYCEIYLLPCVNNHLCQSAIIYSLRGNSFYSCQNKVNVCVTGVKYLNSNTYIINILIILPTIGIFVCVDTDIFWAFIYLLTTYLIANVSCFSLFLWEILHI